MKEKKNYIDNIPKINDMKWDVSEDGIVEITVENTGFYNTIAQKIFKKPRYSFIKLDEYGSFVWQKIDGKKSIYEIGKELQAVHDLLPGQRPDGGRRHDRPQGRPVQGPQPAGGPGHVRACGGAPP